MLHGKTILVTGGARRIGSEIVRVLSSAHAHVVIHCNRSFHDATSLADEVQSNGYPRPYIVRQDLAIHNAGTSLFNQTISLTNGQLDAIVNSASFYEPTPLPTKINSSPLSPSPIDLLHVESPRRLIQCLAEMPGLSPKSVVNILDARITSEDPHHASYLLAKKQLAMLTLNSAIKFAPRLRVNGIAPGAVLPEDHQSFSDFERLANFNPLHMIGNSRDLAKCVLFFLSTDFITGQILFYDGGYHLKNRSASNGFHSY